MNYAKIFFILCLVNTATAVTFLSNTTDGEFLLSNEKYAVTLDMKENRMSLDNILTVYQYPQVNVDGEKITPSQPNINTPNPGREMDEFTVTYPESTKRDVYVSSKITLKEKSIQQTIEIENTRASNSEVRIQLIPPVNKSYYVYAPFLEDTGNYMWISPTPSQEKGEGVAIYFDSVTSDYIQIGDISLEKSPAPFLQWNLAIAPTERKSITVSYITGYVSDLILLSQKDQTLPITKQHLIDIQEDPLFKLYNRESIKQIAVTIPTGEPATIFEKTKNEVDRIPNSPVMGTKLKTNKYNFQEITTKQQLNSLEKSLLFRELLREKGIPAELRITKKDDLYYGKVYAYPTLNPLLYHPQEEIRNYEEIYADPQPAYCKGEVTTCSWVGELKTDLFCVLNFCLSVYVLSALILIISISIFFFLQYKAELFYKVSEKVREGEKKTIEGTYEVLNKDFKPDDPLEKAVFIEIQQSMGIVKMRKYEKKLGFSGMLIKAAVEELENKGVIRKL